LHDAGWNNPRRESFANFSGKLLAPFFSEHSIASGREFSARVQSPHLMPMKRPLPVTVFGCLFILAGTVGLIYHLGERPLERDYLLISAIRVAAVVGGVFLLLGHNWARWLLLAWLAFHVVVSVFHSTQEIVMHLILLLLFAYFLLRPPSSSYFHSAPSE
jgi:hypothetical protein